MLLIKKRVSWRQLLTIAAAVLVKHVHWLTPNTDLGQPLRQSSVIQNIHLSGHSPSHCVQITDILLYMDIIAFDTQVMSIPTLSLEVFMKFTHTLI